MIHVITNCQYAIRRGLVSSWDDSPPITEMDVLWITAGLGCDGDMIAMTAATQPSIEDIVLGGMPWIPKVNFHNPFYLTRSAMTSNRIIESPH